MVDKDFQHDDILARIRKSSVERERVAAELLRDQKLCNGIEKVIKNKGGISEDLRPILHMALVSFFKKALNDRSFQLKTNLYSYLNGIAKYLWYAELRKRHINIPISDEEYQIADENPGHDLVIIDKEKRETLHQVLKSIGSKCKELLMMWASGHSMKEIADKMGYNNEGAVRKKKYDCMKNLATLIAENPHIKKRLE